MEVYNALGPGLLEAAYEKALIHELQLSGLSVASHEFMIFSHRSHETKVIRVRSNDKERRLT